MAERKKIKDNIWLWYTLLFAAAALLAFLNFIIFDKTFVWEVDGYRQHYPHIVNIRHIVKHLIKDHTFSFWMDNMGLGTDLLGSAGIEIMDPYNYIAAAFPIQYIDVGYTAACILRLYTAGLTMLAYLKYHKMDSYRILFGAVGYSLCNWAIFAINHGFFLLPVILFPLVMLGIDKVFDKKNPILLILSVALSFMTYFYFAYMTAIAAFIYIVIRCIFGKEIKSFPEFLLLICKFIGYILIGLFISAPFVFSVIYSILNAPKFSGFTDSFLPMLKEIYNFVPALTGNIDFSRSYAIISFNAVVIALLPIIVINGVKYKRIPALTFTFLLAMTLVPLWNIMMNGFNYKVYRWCYALAFFGIYACADELGRIKQYTDKEKKICIGWSFSQAMAVLLLKALANTFSNEYVIISMCSAIFMFLFLLVFFNAKKSLIYILVGNIALTNTISFSPNCRNKLESFLDRGSSYADYSSSSLRAYDSVAKKDNSFFRVDNIEHYIEPGNQSQLVWTPANEGLFWEARNITTYVSTLDKSSFEYNDGLLNSSNNHRRIYNYTFDNRLRLNYLNGVKYYLIEETTSQQNKQLTHTGSAYIEKSVNKNVVIEKSKITPSLGYVFENSIKRSEYDKLSAVEKEYCLMKNVVIEDDDTDLSATVTGNDIITPGYKVSDDSEIKIENGQFEVTDLSHLLVLEADTKKLPRSDLYVELCDLRRSHYTAEDFAIQLEDADRLAKYRSASNMLFNNQYDNFECLLTYGNVTKRILDTSGEPQGRNDIHDFMSNLGYAKKGNGRVTIEFKTPGKYTIGDIKLYALPVKTFKEDAKALSEKKFEVTSYKSDHIEGRCSADSDGILYLSIPYHMGWTAEVDGQQVETKKVDVCYLGVPVSPGEHTVKLTFRPVLFKESILLMFIGIFGAAAVTVGFFLLHRKRPEEEKKGAPGKAPARPKPRGNTSKKRRR